MCVEMLLFTSLFKRQLCMVLHKRHFNTENYVLRLTLTPPRSCLNKLSIDVKLRVCLRLHWDF